MSLKISRILHAGYVFESEETQIAFDPIFENPFSVNCYAFPEVKFDHEAVKKLKWSAVFISHYHDDHCSLESLNFLDRATPIYLYCVFDELFSMIRDLGFTQVYSLKLDEFVDVGPFRVTARRALDCDVDSLFQVEVEGLKILNVVDSWIDPSMLEQLARFSPWDLVLWPFQTMREREVLSPSRNAPTSKHLPAEWSEQLKILNPRFLIPSSCQFRQESWSWYNHALFPVTYRQFQKEVQEILPFSQITKLNPGASMTLDKLSLGDAAPLDWVRMIGDPNQDYEYVPQARPQSTAEISRKFPRLNVAATKRVFQYCESEILEKYASLGPAEDEFFKIPRSWRLSIFDHEGEAIHFEYIVHKTKLQRAENSSETAWSTEIPVTKLYGALENGETLTSLYLRVNAPVEADIIEDPLIRCLFTGEFGAYQKAQLRRIQASSIENSSNLPCS